MGTVLPMGYWWLETQGLFLKYLLAGLGFVPAGFAYAWLESRGMGGAIPGFCLLMAASLLVCLAWSKLESRGQVTAALVLEPCVSVESDFETRLPFATATAAAGAVSILLFYSVADSPRVRVADSETGQPVLASPGGAVVRG